MAGSLQDQMNARLGAPPPPDDAPVTIGAPSASPDNSKPTGAAPNLDDLYQKYGEKYGLDPRLIRAFAMYESTERADIEGPPVAQWGNQTAKGLMQLSPDLIGRYGIKDWKDPDQNIGGGARYLRELIDQNTKGDGTTNWQGVFDNYSGNPAGTTGGKAYANSVLANYGKIGGDPNNIGLPEAMAGMSLQDQMNFRLKMSAPPPEVPSQAQQDRADAVHAVPTGDPSLWGLAHEALAGALGRFGVSAIASQKAALEGVDDFKHGMPLDQVLHNLWQKYLPEQTEELQHAREAYNTQNPLSSAAANVGGDTLGLTGALMAGEAGLSRVGGALSGALSGPARWLFGGRAVEEAQSVGRFLMGQGGGAVQGTNDTGNALARGASRTVQAIRQGYEQSAYTGDRSPHTDAAMSGGVELINGMITGANPLLRGMAARVEPGIARVANNLLDLDVPIHAGQLAKDALRAPADIEQVQAVTRAANRTMGNDSSVMNKQTWLQDRENIGHRMTAFAMRNPIDSMAVGPHGESLAGDLSAIETQALRHGPSTQPNINKIVNIRRAIEDSVNRTGQISGSDYQLLTAKGSPLWGIMHSSDGIERRFGSQIRTALDSALERSATDPVRDIQEARAQWRSSEVLRKGASNAGEQGDLLAAKDLGPGLRKVYPNSTDTPLHDLAEGARWLDKPNAMGIAVPGSRPPGGHGLAKIGLAAGLGSAGLEGLGQVVEHGLSAEALHTINGSPGQIGMALLGATAGGLAYAGRKAINSVAKSPEYTNMLLGRNTPGAARLRAMGQALRTAPTVFEVGLKNRILNQTGKNLDDEDESGLQSTIGQGAR